MALLGIDIGESAIKIVEIDKKGDSPVLTSWALVDIPAGLRTKHPECEVFQADAIKKFLVHAASKEAVVVVGGLDVVSKIINLPSLGEDEINEAIKWQMKDDIPFKIEEGVFSYFKLTSSDKNKNNYLVVVAKQNVILRALQIMGLAGVKPLSIVPASEALFYSFETEVKQEGIICLLHMGKFLTNISFYENGILQLSRDVPIGSDDITRAMTSILVSEEGRLELDYEQAEKIRTDYGIPIDLENFPKLEHIPIAHLQAVIRPALERMEEEVIRTIEYFRNKINDEKINKIIFTGSASQTPNLAEVLSNSIGIQCEIADPFAKIKIKEDIMEKEKLMKDRPRLSIAAGAAFGGRSKINLIPEEYRERWKVLLKKFLTPQWVGGLALSILLIFYGVLMANVYFLEQQKAEVSAQFKELEPIVKNLESLVESVKEEEGRQGVFLYANEQKAKISDVLSGLSYATPGTIMLQEIEYSPSSEAFSLKGMAFEKDQSAEKSLAKLVSSLVSSDMFKNVELQQAGLGLDYTPKNFKFHIKTEIKQK